MSTEELIREDRLRPVVSGFGKGRYWQYRDIKGHYIVAPTKEEATKRANEALLATEAGMPVKGEQAGMLGVPGKYVEQKRPWRPGQVEIESYVKYKEAMGKTEAVTPEVTEHIIHLRKNKYGVEEFYFDYEGKRYEFMSGYKEQVKFRDPRSGKEIEGLIYPSYAYMEEGTVLHTISKAKAKVEAEAMKQAEKPSKSLYWYIILELKQMCRDRGLSDEGSKESLIRRLK